MSKEEWDMIPYKVQFRILQFYRERQLYINRFDYDDDEVTEEYYQYAKNFYVSPSLKYMSPSKNIIETKDATKY